MSFISLPLDTLNEILLTLKAEDLLNVCRSNQKIRALCLRESFWSRKLQLDFPNSLLSRNLNETDRNYYSRLYQISKTPLGLIKKAFIQMNQIYQEELNKNPSDPRNIVNIGQFPFLQIITKTNILPQYRYYEIYGEPYAEPGGELKFRVYIDDYFEPDATLSQLLEGFDYISMFNYLYDQIFQKEQILALSVSEALHPNNIKRKVYDDSGTMVVFDHTFQDPKFKRLYQRYLNNKFNLNAPHILPEWRNHYTSMKPIVSYTSPSEDFVYDFVL